MSAREGGHPIAGRVWLAARFVDLEHEGVSFICPSQAAFCWWHLVPLVPSKK